MRHMFSDKQLTAKTIADVNKAIEDGQIVTGSEIHVYTFTASNHSFEYITDTELDLTQPQASLMADLKAKGYGLLSFYPNVSDIQPLSDASKIRQFVGFAYENADSTNLSVIYNAYQFTISEGNVVINWLTSWGHTNTTISNMRKKF